MKMSNVKPWQEERVAPGLNKDNIEVSHENTILSVEVVNNESANAELNRFEFDYNSFKRSFKLPDSIDLSKIDAFTEQLIITTGTSTPHISAISKKITEVLKSNLGC